MSPERVEYLSPWHICRMPLMSYLSRLRARVAMLSGAGTQQEGFWRDESARWFAKAVAGSPHDAEALTAAGEGSLEYGR